MSVCSVFFIVFAPAFLLVFVCFLLAVAHSFLDAPVAESTNKKKEQKKKGFDKLIRIAPRLVWDTNPSDTNLRH